ncbi:MAG: glycosyltransferase family 4 protein [Prolixibacteraceae bacterium]|jgi:glycosyltransferase involved in cell wall biosynthesis|nr:glycosyltransferase family 4 protein [Prolixibacteraceae bacterium]
MGKRIKIVLIHTRNIFELDGAGANRWRTMVEGLHQEGVALHIIFTQGYASIREFKKYGWKGSINGISYSYSIFLLQSSLWMRRLSVYVLSPLMKKFNAFRIRKKIKQDKPDIIWLHPSIEVLNIYLENVAHLKLINYKLMIELNEYNDIGLENSTNRLQIAISKRYSSLLLYKILPKVDLLLIMTNHLLEYYRQFTNPLKAQFLHLPMTVDLKRFDVEKKTKERYIAYCGSSSFFKDGVDLMIKSFSMVSAKYPDVNMKIAAFMEADGFKMLALIQELHLQDRVEYVGELKRNEIPEFITNAGLLLLPRPDSRQAQGGFPTKLGEYLATGNPVCITTVGEIPDYLTDNESAFMAEPGSIESFVSALHRALSNPINAIRVGKNGRKVAEKHFNMEIQAKMLFEFISQHVR